MYILQYLYNLNGTLGKFRNSLTRVNWLILLEFAGKMLINKLGALDYSH